MKTTEWMEEVIHDLSDKINNYLQEKNALIEKNRVLKEQVANLILENQDLRSKITDQEEEEGKVRDGIETLDKLRSILKGSSHTAAVSPETSINPYDNEENSSSSIQESEQTSPIFYEEIQTIQNEESLSDDSNNKGLEFQDTENNNTHETIDQTYTRNQDLGDPKPLWSNYKQNSSEDERN